MRAIEGLFTSLIDARRRTIGDRAVKYLTKTHEETIGHLGELSATC